MEWRYMTRVDDGTSERFECRLTNEPGVKPPWLVVGKGSRSDVYQLKAITRDFRLHLCHDDWSQEPIRCFVPVSSLEYVVTTVGEVVPGAWIAPGAAYVSDIPTRGPLIYSWSSTKPYEHTPTQCCVALKGALRINNHGACAVPAAKPSAWNGKCPACQRGIYVGLLAVEHEGGSCPKKAS